MTCAFNKSGVKRTRQWERERESKVYDAQCDNFLWHKRLFNKIPRADSSVWGPQKRKILIYIRGARRVGPEYKGEAEEWNASAVWITFLTRDNHGTGRRVVERGPCDVLRARLGPNFLWLLPALVFARDTHSPRPFPIFLYARYMFATHETEERVLLYTDTQLASANSHHYTKRAQSTFFIVVFVSLHQVETRYRTRVCQSFLSKNRLIYN